MAPLIDDAYLSVILVSSENGASRITAMKSHFVFAGLVGCMVTASDLIRSNPATVLSRASAAASSLRGFAPHVMRFESVMGRTVSKQRPFQWAC